MERKEEKEKEKVKAHRKRSGEHQPLHSTRRETLPTPPPDPTVAAAAAAAAPSGPVVEGDAYACTGSYAETDPFKRLFTYREREAQFLRLLCEGDPATAVQDGGGVGCKKPPGPCHSQSLPGSNAKEPDTPDAPTLGRNEPGFESANEFLMLLNRAGPSVAAALSTKDAIDQLDRLHELIGQMLTLQEQNMRMHWQLKNVETLRKLKLMQLAMAKDPDAFMVGLPEDTSDNDLLDSEIGPNLALLETILAAGNSASSKRSSSKRERSKSVINDEIGNFQLHRKESGGGGGGGGGGSGRNYPLRRQSAISDFKPKVSKWTKVKAAFKWEKTSALPANEIKSTEAMMIPVNNEVARYLRVPSIPCVGSSGDSVFSSSSGIVVSGGSAPGTPGENSLASSAENLTDLNEEAGAATGQRERHGKRDSVKSTERSSQEEDARRSRSLDGEAILEPIRQMDKNKNKSAWSKVKGIVKNHRGSLKSNESRRDAKPSNSVGCSREASPCESMDACEMMQRDRSDSFSSSQASPGHRSSAMTPTFLLLPAASPGSVAAAGGGGDTSAPSGPNSPCSSIPGTQGTFSSGEDGEWRPAPEGRTTRSGSGDRGVPTATLVTPGTGRGSRKSKHIPEIESVPEGVPVETRSPSNSQHTNMTSHNTTATTTTNSSSSSSSISKLRKSPPKPLSLHRQPDSIDVLSTDPAAQSDAAVAQLGAASSPGPKYSPKRKSYAGICLDPDGCGSLPGSPSGKQFSFFAGPADRMVAELIEPDYSSGDVSDQNTPKRRPSPKYHHRTLQRQREEIERRYQELQQKLQHEFDAKQQEWERMRPAAVMLNNSPLNQLLKEEAAGAAGMHGAKAQPPPIVEDNLTPDFKKKLNEWRTKHQPGVDAKKKPITDWQLWKTGQIKLEGQGLKQLPDAKDLPEDFQKKLSEWKQMKAANKVPSYTTQSSQGDSGASMKRQQSKASGGAVKKSKTSDELEKERHHHQAAQQQQQQHHHHNQQQHQQQYLPKAEGLSKLKALVTTSEAPKKELVVQTTKGFIKFEGISRKFTRKLFEWEKAKGIGPEASTIALLHPGYAPVVVETRGVVLENKREKSPALARSLSMDSIAPIPSASSISHQPSSLSLNDADELKDVDKDSGSNRRVSSNPELELSAEREEPGAVLVEVEDEVLEVADPLLMPVLPPEGERRRESTTLGVNQKAKEPGYSSRPSSNSSTILKDSTKLLIRLSEQDSVNRDEVRRLKIVLRALIATLPEFVETGSRDSIAFFAYMKDLALDVLRQLHRFDDGTLRDAGEVLGNVQSINGSVAELKKSLHSYMKYASAQAANGGRSAKDEDIPQISITPAVGAQATSSIQRTDDSFRSMATINVTPTFVCNAVRVNTVELVQPNPSSVVRRFPVSSESERAPLTSQSPDSSAYAQPQAAQCKLDSPEKDVREPGAGKKLQRNLSNGSRRKARIKRMGSRQSSKTESDSDDSPQNYVLDVPRKAKRKTSRAKKPSSDSMEKLATATAGGEKVCEDVVYVLKIKPGQKIEQVERPQPQNASLGMAPGDEVLISPQETCVELMEVGTQSTIQPSVTCTASVLVKTKRKIFTTVDGDNLSAGGVAGQPVAISQELESGSGASDRNDAPETVVNVVLSSPTPQEQKIVTNLPPLPQSPSMQRRMDASKAPNKELSPNIRLMIAKYNQRLTTEKGGASPHSSGSCSPVAWRSPVLDRRVRKQTEKYQETIQLSKSASAGSLRKSLKQLEEEKERGTDSNRGEFGADRDRTRVLKSFSASKIEGTSKDVIERELAVGSGGTEKEPSPELGTFLACDSLRRRDTLSRLERTREQQQQQQQQTVANEPSASIASSPSCHTITSATGTIRKERLYKKRTESPIATGTGTGSIKKSAGRTEKYTRCRSVPNEECAVEVLISSKALKPPSPRLIARRRLNLEQQQQQQRTGEFSKSAPTTPLEENRSILVPLSQRALKLKKAKEDFLRAPLGGDRAALGNGCSQEAAEHQPWSNRISQISATSTASSSVVEGELTLLMKSASAGVIGARSVPDHDGTVTLRRNESGSSYVEGEPGPPGASSRHSISTGSTAGVATGSIAAGSGGSRFGGLSNLASKLRKVKLRRSSKDLSKMNAISALCRQSLMVDISGEAAAKMGSAQSLGSPRRAGREDGEQDEGRDGDGAEPLKKSGSVQAICNRFRRSGERSDELKKSRSLGFLEPDRKGSG